MHAFVLIVLPCLMFGSGDDDRKAICRATASAYEANRAAFPSGTIRYQVSTGTAPNLDAAIRGEWTSRISAPGLCVYDGKRGRVEVLYTLQELVAHRVKTGPNSWSSFIHSDRRVTDGSVTLYDLINANEEGTALIHTS